MSKNEYKQKLAQKQIENFGPIHAWLRQSFKVDLKVWHHVTTEDQHPSIENINSVVDGLDPWALNSIF